MLLDLSFIIMMINAEKTLGIDELIIWSIVASMLIYYASGRN